MPTIPTWTTTTITPSTGTRAAANPRGRRLLIASLVLPCKPAFSDDFAVETDPTSPKSPPYSPTTFTTPKSPTSGVPSLSLTPASGQISGSGTTATTAGKRLQPRVDAPLKSIVDDLTTKKAGTPVVTPQVENVNPFAAPLPSITSALSATRNAVGAAATAVLPSALTLTTNAKPAGDAPKSSTALPRKSPQAKKRSLSRSASRRRRSSTSSPRPADLFLAETDFVLEPSPHANGGLHNAVHAVFPRDGVAAGQTGTTRAAIEKLGVASKTWIGILDMFTDEFREPKKREIERKLSDECESVPVWCSDEEFHGCYNVFCHQVLWPSLHYAVPDAPKSKVYYESGSYAQYFAVNQRFADAIVEIYKPGDIIWIHDYHLMLLPLLLRKALGPSAIIGFFLHVAFPSSEIFRCLAVREDLLRGMLGADLIGFQTHNYARHFRQTCFRILSLESLPKGIQLEHSFVDVAVFPMGIDVAALNAKRKDPEVDEWISLLKQRYAGMKIIVGRDKLDEVQGVKQKLLAFETFLEKNPEYQGKAVLIQVALTTTEQNELQIQSGITSLLSRINSRFSSLTYQPVVFLHTNDLTFNQYLGLLTVADAFLVSSLREGMALRTHEYVVCQEGRYRPLILSEFTGTYSYSGFRSCLPINPWDSKTTAEAMKQALTMSDDEAHSRWKDLQKHVTTQTAQTYVTSFLTRSVRVNLEHQHRDSKSIPTLNPSTLLPRYNFTKKRLFLLDLEGTLWSEDPKVVKEQGFELPETVKDLLKGLIKGDEATGAKNVVWVLSGLPVKGVLEKIEKEVPELGLVAENGCFIKPPGTSAKPGEWISMVSESNLTWKSICVEMLTYFSERTPGSFIDVRAASVAWRFITGKPDEAQRQWARRQAAEAQNHIWDSLGERFGLRIIPGSNSFLVLPRRVSRSHAVLASLNPASLGTRNPSNPNSPSTPPTHLTPFSPVFSAVDQDADELQSFGFILTVSGDDRLIQKMNELGGVTPKPDVTGPAEGDDNLAEEVQTPVLGAGNVETCVTRGRNSDAKWRLDSKDVVETLRAFVKQA